MSWNDEREELLKRLWGDGLSDAQIASRLGGVSRNAVIGKRMRLKLTRHDKGKGSLLPRVTSAVRRPRTPAKVAKVARPSRIPQRFMTSAPSNQLPLPFVPPVERKSILDLGEHDCRWPCTESPPHMFCGRPKGAGVPYCTEHFRAAYPLVTVRSRPIMPAKAPAQTVRVVEEVA